jgi:hypothetical protein
MIVRPSDGHLLLITQPDHAALAASMMNAWRADGFPASPRRDVTLSATMHHDDGWIEVDRAPLVNEANGRLLDFIGAPDAVRLAVWPRVVARLSRTPYAAALVAQHALRIFDPHRAAMDLRAFFAEMEALRDRALADAAPLSLDDLVDDYFFVGMGDTLSLTFCNAWTEERRLAQYHIVLRGSRLTIDPDPFGGHEVPLHVTARRLPDRSFTATEAAAAFDAAPLVTLPVVLSGPIST